MVHSCRRDTAISLKFDRNQKLKGLQFLQSSFLHIGAHKSASFKVRDQLCSSYMIMDESQLHTAY